MNKTNFKQYDTRWAKLGYPKKPWYIKDCGCGEVAIANCIIEMSKYAKETPKTIQPYCKQYAAPNGNGTYFAGIPKMMAHYGMTEVKEHATMDSLWKELKKGGRVAIYLMGNRKGGSKGVHWTSSAHFVASVQYKYEKGDHWVYMKDSNSTSSLRNGWISYRGNLRNDVSRVWSAKLPAEKPTTPKPTKSIDDVAKEVLDGKWGNGDDRVKKLKEAGYDPDAVQKRVNELLAPKKSITEVANEVINGEWGSGDERKKRLTDAGYDYDAVQKKVNELLKPKELTKQEKACAWAKDIAASKYHYVKWRENVAATHTCPICKGRKYDNYFGWNCIGFAWGSWRHGAGLKSKCNCHVFTDADYEKLLKVSSAEALKIAKSKIGLDDVKVIRNTNGIDINKLKAGTIIAYFNGNKYVHTALAVGSGKIADCTSGRKDGIKYGINSYSKWKIKLAFEYTGK